MKGLIQILVSLKNQSQEKFWKFVSEKGCEPCTQGSHKFEVAGFIVGVTAGLCATWLGFLYSIIKSRA